MAFLRRGPQRPADPRPSISAFWAWWSEHRDAVLTAARTDRDAELAALLDGAVRGLDAALEWDLEPDPERAGDTHGARGYTLTVTPGGDSNADVELRALTERWHLAAPHDPDVAFAPARQPVPGGGSRTVHVDDYDIDLAELVTGAGVDPRRGVLDVVVHHPLFPLLDEAARERVARLGLAAALGEDDMRRWIATITVSADQPVDAIPIAMVTAVVDQLRPRDPWVSLQGTGRKGPVVAVARRPLLRIDRPLADTHVGVVLGYKGQQDGLPRDEAVAVDARRLQDRILSALGGDGPHAMHAGHLTGARHVVAHFYVDGLDVDVTAADPVVREWAHGPAVARHTYDPQWDQVAVLRG